MIGRHGVRSWDDRVRTGTDVLIRTAFVPYAGGELHKMFSRHHERVIGNDNVVTFGRVKLQIERQTFPFSMAKCRVLVREHLSHSPCQRPKKKSGSRTERQR